MSMLVDLTDVSTTLDEVILGLKKIGSEIGVEVTLRLAGGGERKRFAILLTKEPHCLETADSRLSRAANSTATPWSRSPTTRCCAASPRRPGIPFLWRGAEDKAAARSVPRREHPRVPRGARRARTLHAHPLTGVRQPVPEPHHQHPPVAAAVPSRAPTPTSRRGRKACGCRDARRTLSPRSSIKVR